jgi:hypothetical protein
VQFLLVAIRVAVLLLGIFGVWSVMASSVRTVILPRAVTSRITSFVFRTMRRLYELWIGKGATYERRDQVMASLAPFSLIALLITWLAILVASYTAIFWGLGHPAFEAFQLSGSSIVALGDVPRDLPSGVALLTESVFGLIELALLITYLPAMYAAFQRRESMVTKLEVRAGSPPSGVAMLERFHRLHRIERLSQETWEQWENWFADLEESHTSLPALNWFRSPQPQRSWITAAGAVLDAASLYASTLAIEHDAHADLAIRAGYIALRHIAAFFRLPFNPDPQRGDPISIAREEFDAAYDALQHAGLPVRRDRDQAWEDFAGWRVNYDDVLIALADQISAPYAPWSSDRGMVRRPNALRALVGF